MPVIKILPHAEYCPAGAQVEAPAGTSICEALIDLERLTGALLDRLTHHVHILEMNGDSYRLKESKQNKTGKARA